MLIAGPRLLVARYVRRYETLVLVLVATVSALLLAVGFRLNTRDHRKWRGDQVFPLWNSQPKSAYSY